MTPEDEWSGKVICPGCGEQIPCVATAYGLRAVCSEEARRWTKIRERGVLSWTLTPWTEETYSAMADNVRKEASEDGKG